MVKRAKDTAARTVRPAVDGAGAGAAYTSRKPCAIDPASSEKLLPVGITPATVVSGNVTAMTAKNPTTNCTITVRPVLRAVSDKRDSHPVATVRKTTATVGTNQFQSLKTAEVATTESTMATNTVRVEIMRMTHPADSTEKEGSHLHRTCL